MQMEEVVANNPVQKMGRLREAVCSTCSLRRYGRDGSIFCKLELADLKIKGKLICRCFYHLRRKATLTQRVFFAANIK